MLRMSARSMRQYVETALFSRPARNGASFFFLSSFSWNLQL